MSESINEIQEKLQRIGKLAREAVRLTFKGLDERDFYACDKVIDLEKQTDHLNLEIEDQCLKTISKEKLTGRDFRFVAMAMKISERFERVADLTVIISDLCKRGIPKVLLEPGLDLIPMSKIALEMIDINLRALSSDFQVSESELKDRDGVVDETHEKLYGKLVAYVHQNPKAFDDAFLLLMIAMRLGRIADIACKIGNRIIYINEGKRVWIK